MPTYEMFWDCESCGATKLLGKSHRHCPTCGSPQDPQRRYFPAEHEKVAVEDHEFVGVDRECEACETPNSAAAVHCVNCGAPMDGSAAVSRRERLKAGDQSGSLEADGELPDPEDGSEEEDPGESDGVDPSRDPRTSERETPSPLSLTERISRLDERVKLGCGGALILAVVALFMWSEPTEVEVTGHHWERSVQVLRFTTVSEGDWCDAMPSDAYSVSRSTQQRGTSSSTEGGGDCSEVCDWVNVDNGDGTFGSSYECYSSCSSGTTVETPVYDEWCDYTVDRWVVDHVETAAGEGTSPAPHWPSVTTGGDTKRGAETETYTVEFQDVDGNTDGCNFSQETWNAMWVGNQCPARRRVITKGVVCAKIGMGCEQFGPGD